MRKALVILSGGQDSATCLAWAKHEFDEVHAVTFNYGQRHARELDAAKDVAKILSVASHEIVDVGPVLIGTSALVNGQEAVGHYDSAEKLPGGIEPTFVPGRNLLFCVLASNRAAVKGIRNLVLGVCQADYGGYPDCRQGFVNAMASALSLGVYGSVGAFSIHTPLMNLTKKQSVELAMRLPGAMEALAVSHTCYDGEYPPNPYNHASLLRAKGFKEAGVPDPLIERAIKEGFLPTDYPKDGYVEGTPYADGVTHRPPGGAAMVVFTSPSVVARQKAEAEKEKVETVSAGDSEE